MRQKLFAFGVGIVLGALLVSGTVGAVNSITGSRLTLPFLNIIGSGTAAAPSLSLGETDTGLHLSGADTLGLTADGTLIANVYGGSGAAGAGLYLPSDTGRVVFGVSSDTKIERSAANTLTTGIWASLKPTQTIAGTGAITTCKGHTILVTSAGTATLPAATTIGQACSVVSTTAAVVSVDPASTSDTVILNGTALTAGNKATSDGTDEAALYCENTVANTWRCRTTFGIFVDGGA